MDMMEALMKNKPMQVRLPQAIKDWLAAEAEKNGSSQNSEVIRAVRERMEREEISKT